MSKTLVQSLGKKIPHQNETLGDEMEIVQGEKWRIQIFPTVKIEFFFKWVLASFWNVSIWNILEYLLFGNIKAYGTTFQISTLKKSGTGFVCICLYSGERDLQLSLDSLR